MGFKEVGKSTGKFLVRHSPEILTGLGVAGVVVTAIFVAEATPKAVRIIEEKEAKTVQEKIKVTWKLYIPAVAVGVTTIACIIGATSVNLRRNAAIGAAYSLTESFAHEYKSKVVDILGEQKEQEIRDEIATDRVQANPITEQSPVYIYKSNDDLIKCLEPTSMRYFYSNVELLRKVQNDLNERIFKDEWVSLNDLYFELHLPGTKIGELLGWSFDYPIEMEYSATLDDDDLPVLCVDFIRPPRPDYC